MRGALTAVPLAVEELANLINSETFFQAKKNHPCRNRGGFSQIDYLLRPVVKKVSHEFDDVVQTYRVHDEAPHMFKKLRHTLALLRGANLRCAFRPRGFGNTLRVHPLRQTGVDPSSTSSRHGSHPVSRS